MKILMITYNDELCSHVRQCFEKCGQEVILFSFPQQINTEEFVLLSEENRMALSDALQNNAFDVIFSIEYLHEVSVFANALGVIYLSWILYFPNPDLYRNSVSNVCNAIFCCDSGIVEMIKSTGAENVFYLPGGAMYAADEPVKLKSEITEKNDSENEDKLKSEIADNDSENEDNSEENEEKIEKTDSEEEKIEYKNEENGIYYASFIGKIPQIASDGPFGVDSLLSGNCRGYIDGMAHCQRVLYGDDIIRGNIPHRIKDELLEKYPVLAPQDIYTGIDELICNQFFYPYISYQEKTIQLSKVAGSMKFYSDLKVNDDECDRYDISECITDIKKRQEIYRKTKINYYTANRNMPNAIPHQCFDIMAAGGFLLTGPQNDLFKHFENKKDLVVFENDDDLAQKFLIYSHNEDQRNEIAENGFLKVKNNHLIIHRIKEILSVF